MRKLAVLVLCSSVVFLWSGCGLTSPQPNPLGVDESVADAAQIVQSIKNDITAKKIDAVPTTMPDDALADSPITQPIAVSDWLKKNWGWLSWLMLMVVFCVMYLADKCSEKWGIPSRATMARMSYYLTRGLPITQKTIYAALRIRYLKKKSK